MATVKAIQASMQAAHRLLRGEGRSVIRLLPATVRVLAVVGIAVPVIAASVRPGEASGDQPSGTQAPIAPSHLPHGLQMCDANPAYMALSEQSPFILDLVGWWAEGFEMGTQVGWEIYDLVNPGVVQSGSVTVDSFCNAQGWFRLPYPLPYQVTIRGRSSVTHENLTLRAFPRPVLRPTPMPVPTLGTRPEPPSGFRATVVNQNTVRFDWTDNATNETGFVITTPVGDFKPSANASTYSAGGFVPGEIYCFSIFSVNGVGRSYGGSDCVIIRDSTRDRPSLGR
jgi:hypothetical protein